MAVRWDNSVQRCDDGATLTVGVERAGVTGILRLITEAKALRGKRGEASLQVQQAIVVTNAAPFPLSPPAFENLCGKSSNMKWKQSLKLTNQQHVSVGRMMEEQQLEGPSSHQAAVSRDRLARDVYSMTEAQALAMARSAAAQANPHGGEPMIQLPALPGAYLAVRTADASADGTLLTVMQLLDCTHPDAAVAVTLDKQIAHIVRLRSPGGQPCSESAQFFTLTPPYQHRFTPNTAAAAPAPRAAPARAAVKAEARASEDAYMGMEASGDSTGAPGMPRMRRKRSLPEPVATPAHAVERAPSWESSWTGGMASPAMGQNNTQPGGSSDPLARLALVAAEFLGAADDVSATAQPMVGPASPGLGVEHSHNASAHEVGRPAKRAALHHASTLDMLPLTPLKLEAGLSPASDDSAACCSAGQRVGAPGDASGNSSPRRPDSSSGSVRTGVPRDTPAPPPAPTNKPLAPAPAAPAAQAGLATGVVAAPGAPPQGVPAGLPVSSEHLMLLLLDRHMRIAELEQQLSLHNTALAQLASLTRGNATVVGGGDVAHVAATVVALTQALSSQRQASADLAAAHTALLARCESLTAERDTAMHLLRAKAQVATGV